MESKPIFICDFNNCEKIFTTKYSLHRHSLTHNVKKAHVCKQCDKKFTIKQNLIEHEFVHTGELPYACNIDGCAERFRQRGKLSLHRQSHKSYQKKSYKSHVKINDTEDKPLTKIEVSDERMNQPSRLQSVGTSYITTTSEGCRNMSYQIAVIENILSILILIQWSGSATTWRIEASKLSEVLWLRLTLLAIMLREQLVRSGRYQSWVWLWCPTTSLAAVLTNPALYKATPCT